MAMQTYTKTLSTDTITLPDIILVYNRTKASSKAYRYTIHTWSGMTITEVKLSYGDLYADGYAYQVNVNLMHPVVRRTSSVSNQQSRLYDLRRNLYILSNVNDEGFTSTGYRLATTSISSGSWQKRLKTIFCGEEPQTFTLSNLILQAGSVERYANTASTIYAYSGDPITIEIPQKTKSKITLDDGGLRDIAPRYYGDWTWTKVNYITIGSQQHLPDGHDLNGKWIFEGWYEDSNFTIPANLNFEVPFEDKTFYSKWKQVQPRVIIGVNGGLKQGEIRIRKENEIITPWKGYKKVNGIWRPIS